MAVAVRRSLLPLLPACFLLAASLSSSLLSASPLLGVAPQGNPLILSLSLSLSLSLFLCFLLCFLDLFSYSVGGFFLDELHYAGAVIACWDGTKSFTRDRLNDGFCDCPDGTDEPGTSACPESKFYCRNVGDMPHFLFSSRVNDHICDCCDGSDEYDGGISCSNTCLKDGNSFGNNIDDYDVTAVTVNDIHTQEMKTRIDLEDLVHKLRGLRIVVMIEFGVAMCVLSFCVFYRHSKSQRRQNFRRNLQA